MNKIGWFSRLVVRQSKALVTEFPNSPGGTSKQLHRTRTFHQNAVMQVKKSFSTISVREKTRQAPRMSCSSSNPCPVAKTLVMILDQRVQPLTDHIPSMADAPAISSLGNSSIFYFYFSLFIILRIFLSNKYIRLICQIQWFQDYVEDYDKIHKVS